MDCNCESAVVDYFIFWSIIMVPILYLGWRIDQTLRKIAGEL